MRIKIKVCIAIMLTIILSVNVIAFASYENKIIDSNVDIIEENNNEFEYTGVPSGKIVTASQLKEDRMRDVVITTIIAITLALIFYFLIKLIMFIIANKKYRKAIQEGKKVDKPKIKVKLKYILLLFITIDVLIWVTVIMMNLL